LTGSLAKLVYFTKDDNHLVDGEEGISDRKTLQKSNGSNQHPVLNGRLNFKTFETSKINDCLEFIKSMKLHVGGMYIIIWCLWLTKFIRVTEFSEACNLVYV